MSCVISENTSKSHAKNMTSTLHQPYINNTLLRDSLQTISNTGKKKIKHFDEDNFDSLGHGYTLAQCAVAGSIAGICEHSLLFPFDAIKTNQQSLPINQFKFADSLRYYFTLRAWRGITTNMTGVAIAHAVQFPVIEATCGVIENRRKNQKSIFYNSPVNASFVAGMVGSVPHDLIMNPVNVIKQRLQLLDSPHKTARECYHSNTCRTLYASFPVQLGCTAIYHGLYYYCYNDLLRKRFDKTFPEYQNGVCSFIFRSITASIIAVAATQHLDAVVTRVNTQKCITCPELKNLANETNITIKHATKDVINEGLINSFKRGLLMRTICLSSANLITWGAYELIKVGLRKQLTS